MSVSRGHLMNKVLFLFILITLTSVNVFAGVHIHTAPFASNGDENSDIQDISEKQKIIDTLENDIAILDKEIQTCQKQKKGWIAATVIGGVGALATGTAAIVQGVKIKDAKETITDKKKERAEAKATLENLK